MQKYDENIDKFFIFARNVMWYEFRRHGQEFREFCKVIGDECFGTFFMPENRDEFCKKTGSAIIQLYFPGIIRYADVNGKKISSGFIEEVINLRKVNVKKAVVIAMAEDDFKDFDCRDDKFTFVLLDRNRVTGEYSGTYAPYTVINGLIEAVAILKGQQ